MTFTVRHVPFPILLVITPSLLKHKTLSQGQIFIAGIFPLPFLIIWMFKTVRYNIRKFLQFRNKIVPNKRLTKIHVAEDTECSSAIYDVLQGPYRNIHIKGLGCVCWTGITMIRRLLLCVTYTFIANSLIRVVVLMLINLVGIVQLFVFRPYKQSNGNRIELFLSGVLSGLPHLSWSKIP